MFVARCLLKYEALTKAMVELCSSMMGMFVYLRLQLYRFETVHIVTAPRFYFTFKVTEALMNVTVLPERSLVAVNPNTFTAEVLVRQVITRNSRNLFYFSCVARGLEDSAKIDGSLAINYSV